jgi:putative DNA methylase
MTSLRKLIEVSLPLEAINKESAREKSIRHGHPSTLHLWWARRPLAACRAVLWSSLVDDPSEYMPDEKSANEERERLFKILEELVLWENVNNDEVLDKARLEIARSVARNLGVDVPVGKEAIREFLATKAPPVLDPFAGGGSIPLEAQRLGLRAYASDLNPVAVLINKALIEIPPKFAGMAPVHPVDSGQCSVNSDQLSVNSDQSSVTSGKKRGKKKEAQPELWQREWKGAQGLAEDVRYYGKWMRDEAFKRIGHLYPPVILTKEMLAERPDLKEQGLKSGDELTVIAWLWARTVKCPNPACGAEMPLVKSFSLSIKKNKQAWIEPIIDYKSVPTKITFTIKKGSGKPHEGTVTRTGATCIACNTPVPLQYLRNEAAAERMSAQLMAIVVDARERTYVPPEKSHVLIASEAMPEWIPDQELQGKCRVSVPLYGMNSFGSLFTSRQLTALSNYSRLVLEAKEMAYLHAISSGRYEKSSADSYSRAIATYLAFAVDKMADTNTSLCSWQIDPPRLRSTFGRQALPMVWDFAEANVFGDAAGDYQRTYASLCEVLDRLTIDASEGQVAQFDATAISSLPIETSPLISTDPPYYDNICYADLSDFFYVWLRLSAGSMYPELFSTLLTPKSNELIASTYRFNGDSEQAGKFFEDGLRKAFCEFVKLQDSTFPITVYYAFKQSEDDENEGEISVASTGWETMLEGLVNTGYSITGTWPTRSELDTRNVGRDANALASSIVLVCRPRIRGAISTSRREFLSALKKELAPALHQLQQGSIAPVDLAQAAIGPGMAVFSRYNAVLEADGTPMRVRTALALINQALDEYLTEQEGEYDSDTRWALAWFEQFGHNEASYGVAETLSTAKNTSVEGLAEAGILAARGGKVRLLRREEIALTPVPSPKGRGESWDPRQDKRLTAWESVQHLIYELDKNGEEAAAALLARLGGMAETARDLAYRLYTVCERKGWAQDALAYNMLAVAWPRLKELAARQVQKQEKLL